MEDVGARRVVFDSNATSTGSIETPSLVSDQCFWCPSDRLRTTTNVLGDSLGAGIIEHLSRKELQCQDAEVRSCVIEDKEKAYQLICQENDVINHPNSETTM